MKYTLDLSVYRRFNSVVKSKATLLGDSTKLSRQPIRRFQCKRHPHSFESPRKFVSQVSIRIPELEFGLMEQVIMNTD